jgi:Flp pilus assembly protein TadD
LYGGLAATWLILTGILWSGPRQEQQGGFNIGNSLSYAANQGVVIMHYLRLILWPKGLCLDYNKPKLEDWGKLMPPMLAVLVMLAVTVWGIICNRAWAYPAAWLFVVLSPTSSFVPIADLIFEHRMYLPTAGLAVLVVLAGYILSERWSAKKTQIILPMVVICVLTLLTLLRNSDYHSAASIWRTVLDVVPENTHAHTNLGAALESDGNTDEAIKHYRKALELNPRLFITYNDLGVALKSQGRLEEAVSCYHQAIQLKPDYAEAYSNLGNVLRGKPDEAISYYREAIRLKPDFADAHVNLGVALSEQGKTDEGIAHLQQALQIKPNSAEAHNDLGIAFRMKGNLNEAVLHYRQVITLKPDWPSPLNGLAWILATYPDPNMRDATQAIGLAERAAALTKHQDAIILNTLAAAYAAADRFSEAAATAQKALDLASDQRSDQLADSIRQRLEMYKQGKFLKQ